MRNLVVTR